MTEEQILRLEKLEYRIRNVIICFLICFVISLMICAIKDMNINNHTNVINGHYTITYIKDGVKCQYKTDRIKFHDNDNTISFHDQISGNEIIINHYVIELEDDDDG